MNKTKTSLDQWLKCVDIARENGLHLVSEWIFKDEQGTHFDLSAADFNQLDRIKREKLFVVEALT